MKENNSRFGITASTLKWIAIIFMILNHFCSCVADNFEIDNYFFNEFHWYATRLAFVIFAFQITEGVFYTKDKIRYIAFLFLFAAISEIPYDLVVFGKVYDPSMNNVLWTFGLGACVLSLIDRYGKKPFVILSSAIVAMFIGFMIGSEYIFEAIPMMICFYVFREKKLKALLLGAIMFVIFTVVDFVLEYVARGYDFNLVISSSLVWKYIFEEWHGLLAFPLIMLYNGKKGRNINKWFFYFFYPTHLLLIAVSCFIVKALI